MATKVSAVLSLVWLLFVAQTAMADDPACLSVDQNSDVNTRCRTSKGEVFVRVNDPSGAMGWKDTGDFFWGGITWIDPDPKAEKVLQRNSDSHCFGMQSLPTKDDINTAANHGIAEVFKGMKTHWYWSSTAEYFRDTDFELGYYVLDGADDALEFLQKRWSDNLSLSVICVDRK